MAAAQKIIEVHLRDLTTDFDVRKKLNDSHVYNMALLYEAGEELPPIIITKGMKIIDGRHRKAAMELAGRQVARCIIATETDECVLITEALKANVGGPLPPSKEDIVHAILLLLAQGWKEKRISDSLPFPRTVSRKYITEANAYIIRAKLAEALKAIAEDGMTLKAASEKFDVPEEKLKEHMNPNRKKREQQSIKWRQTHISRAYNGFGRKIGHEIQKVFDMYEDKEITENDVLETLDHIFDLIKKGEKRVEEHRERFRNLAREFSKLAEIKT